MTTRKSFVLFAVFLFFCDLTLAQDARGTISGRVVDRSEAVIVGVRVKATNVQTGVAASARTNETGAFRLPFLVPGVYRLTADISGFKTYAQDNVQLRVSDSLDLTIRLDVGDTSERVEVRADSPLLETGSASLGQVIDERRLLELPQKGGDCSFGPITTATQFPKTCSGHLPARLHRIKSTRALRSTKCWCSVQALF